LLQFTFDVDYHEAHEAHEPHLTTKKLHGDSTENQNTLGLPAEDAPTEANLYKYYYRGSSNTAVCALKLFICLPELILQWTDRTTPAV
jgi:hypothetical protein